MWLVGASAPSSWNRHAYVSGDPVNKVDPEGLQDEGPGDIIDCGCSEECPRKRAGSIFELQTDRTQRQSPRQKLKKFRIAGPPESLATSMLLENAKR